MDDSSQQGDPSSSQQSPTPPEAVELAHQLLDLARAGDSTLLDYVDRGAPVDIIDSHGNTLLMTAATHGHAALVSQLAERGADIDALNGRGQSPLAGAVAQGHDDVVRALVEAGADPDKGNPTALETAGSSGLAHLADLMRRS